jgi:hypothetical protein
MLRDVSYASHSNPRLPCLGISTVVCNSVNVSALNV